MWPSTAPPTPTDPTPTTPPPPWSAAASASEPAASGLSFIGTVMNSATLSWVQSSWTNYSDRESLALRSAIASARDAVETSRASVHSVDGVRDYCSVTSDCPRGIELFVSLFSERGVSSELGSAWTVRDKNRTERVPTKSRREIGG